MTATTDATKLPVSSPRPHQHLGLALVVIATAQLMVMLDLTIVNIALPAMQRALGFSSTGLVWVVDAYVLAFGGLLLLGGRSGDLFGRRRMFLAGIALFSLASLLGGLATTQAWLVAARSVQGIGAAIASPTALSLIATTFPEGAPRHRAMAVYAGMSGAGAAIGLLAGGALVDALSWRWVLFVNVPIGLALLLIGPAVLPRTERRPGRLDLPGALTVSGGLALAVYGLERTASSGWGNPATLAVFAGAVVLLAGFVLVERNTTAALVPMRFLAHRNRGGGFAVMLLLGGAMLSLLYFLTQFLQEVLHYSPIDAGLAYLPLPVAVGVTGLVVSRLVGRFGIRPFLLAGPLLVAGGLWWVSLLTSTSSYPSVFGPLVVVGLGMGLSFVPLTLNAVAGVPDREAGLASGLLNTSQQFGGSLGLAALVTVAASAAAHHVATAGHTLGSAPVGASVASQGAGLAEAAHVAGFQAALRGGALAAGIAFLVSLLVLRAARATTGAGAGKGAGEVETGPGAVAQSLPREVPQSGLVVQMELASETALVSEPAGEWQPQSAGEPT